MAADPLEQVLRLVAEGRLSAEEAAPILAALDNDASRRPPSAERPGGFGPTPPPDSPPPDTGPGARGATSLRIEVRDKGRSVVNLRLPIAVGRFALDRVPGLSGDQVARVRDALGAGLRGPVLEVNENGDGDGVRIVLE
jgi:SHOCT-like domain